MPEHDPSLYVLDLHTHPTLKTYMFKRRFWRRHHPPGFLFPFTLRTDLDALLEGNVKGLLCATYVTERGWLEDCWPIRLQRPWNDTLDRIFTEAPDDMAREYLNHLDWVIRDTVARRGPHIEVAKSFSEMQRIWSEGKIAILNSMEGAHHLNGNLDNLQDFFERGVCKMIVPHMYPNEACWNVDAIPETILLRKLGCFKQKSQLETGLTPWGRELIERMLDIGMIVDMTHGTPQFRKEVLDLAAEHPRKRPVVMSHVGVHALAPYPMNPTPEDIRRITDTGGVVGIIAMSYWLSRPEIRDCREVLLKTVAHLIEHGGDDVVAFGSDFDGFTGVPRDWKSPREYNNVRAWLLEKYSVEQVRKFLNGNAERVLREGWGKQ